MHRRTNRKNPYETSDMVDSVVNVYNNMYGDVRKDTPSTKLPNILNFDLNNGQSRYGQLSSGKNFSLFENESLVGNPTVDSGKKSESKNKQNPVGTKSTAEKYGVKTLVNTKSKMTYPFDKPIEQSVEKPVAPIATNDDVDKYIEKESLAVKETFIEPEKLPESDKLAFDKEETGCEGAVGTDGAEGAVGQYGENTVTVEPTETPTPLSGDQSVPNAENFSDIENRMGRSGNPKKIDNKNDESNIVAIENKDENTTNMATVTKEVPVSAANENPVAVESVPEPAVVEPKAEEKPVETKELKEEFQWPELTIENIITTFKVVGDLREGYKLKVENDRFLTIDASYVPSFSRWRNDQGREKIISYLGHLLKETKRTINKLVKDIRDNIDVDANISIVEKLISRMSIFLHTYDIMKVAYKTDAGAYARLGAIRDEFYDFRGNLFRDILIRR